MIKYIYLTIALILAGCSTHSLIKEDPMYGNAPKSPQQQEADRHFIESAMIEHGTKGRASKVYSDQGWKDYRAQKYPLAMQQFNRAWLLDNTNAYAYWGFAAVWHQWHPKEYERAIGFLKRARAYASEVYEISLDLALFHARPVMGVPGLSQEEKGKLLNVALMYYKMAESLRNDDPDLYYQMAAVHFLKGEMEAASALLQMCESLKPSAELMQDISVLKEDMGKGKVGLRRQYF